MRSIHVIPTRVDLPDIFHAAVNVDRNGFFTHSVSHDDCALCKEGHCTQYVMRELGSEEVIVHGLLLQ